VQESGSYGVAALSCSGNLDHKPTIQWQVKTKFPVTISPAATEKWVFFEGLVERDCPAILCIDRNTGANHWGWPIRDGATGEFVVNGDHLIIADSGSSLTCFDLSKFEYPNTRSSTKIPQKGFKKLWNAQVVSCVGAPAVSGDLVVVTAKQGLQAIDRSTGQTLWTEKLDSPPLTGPVISGDRVWVGSVEGLRGYSLVQGEAPRVVECGPVMGRIIAEGERLVCVTAAGELIVADAEKGTITARIPDVNTSVGPILAGDTLLYAAKDSLVRYDLRTKQGALWAKISATWPGTIVTPMIMVDSHVLFGTDKRGFVCYKPKKGS
jgi:outer membrane protein assembly factor BamB